MEEGDETEQSSWAYLPDACLRRVFHWLDDRDRSVAALVCKKWNQAISSGSLWRRRTIGFYSRPTRAQTQAFQCALWYLKKFGEYLEHLEIELPSPSDTSFAQRFQVTMKDLFSHLGECNHRLVSLSIEYLEIDHYYFWKKEVRAKFIENLATFLKRMSKQLDYLNLKGARVTLEEGCELLNFLSCLTNKSSISNINIEDFFGVRLPVYSSMLFHQTMSKFHGLVILTSSYNHLSNELLDILQEHSTRSLCTMNIRCCICDPPEQVVSGLSWANLSKRAPKLNVNFIFDRVISHNHLARILLAEVPVRSISLLSSILSPPDWRMKPTLTSLLPAYGHVLQGNLHVKKIVHTPCLLTELKPASTYTAGRLTLELENDHELLDEELLQLILSCKRLSFLKVWAFLSVTFVERLLQNRAERKCVLNTVKVRIYTAQQDTSEQEQLLSDIYKKFRYLIDSELDWSSTQYCKPQGERRTPSGIGKH